MRRRALLGLGAIALSVVTWGLPVRAAEPDALGWWWLGRPSAMLPALFSPVPEVPEGGLYVAGDAGGPSGISALRFELAPDTLATTLTLRIAETQGTPIVEACAANETWVAAENGGWDQRPTADCDAFSAPGVVDADGSEVRFALSVPAGTDIVDVVLVPGMAPESEAPAGFSTAFDAPGQDALETSPAPSRQPVPASGSPTFETDSSPPPQPVAPAAPLPTPDSAPAPVPLRTVEVPGAPAAPEAPGRDSPEPARPTTLAAFPDADDFSYPAVLALPLALLVLGAYASWALTRPLAVRGQAR